VKKSASAAVPLLASAALAMITDCRSKEMHGASISTMQSVDAALCQTAERRKPIPRIANHGGDGSKDLGTLVSGGSFSPIPGHSYEIADAATGRGGFGNTFWFVAGIATLIVVGAGG
jgi:hypothetical protein